MKKYNSVTDVVKAMNKAVGEWTKGWNENAIEQRVNDILNQKATEFIYTVMGMTNRFGKWEIDNHFSRKDFIIDEWVSNTVKNKVNEWLESNLSLVIDKKMKSLVVKVIQEELEQKIDQAIRSKLWRELENLSEKLATEAVKHITEESWKEMNEILENMEELKKVNI